MKKQITILVLIFICTTSTAYTQIITTIAGNGLFGYSGDGGQATDAQIGRISGIAVDSTGNIYFAGINRIRKIAPSGIITTIAGNGIDSFSGDGGPATAATIGQISGIHIDRYSNIYITDNREYIRKINASGIITSIAGTGITGYSGDGGPATAAKISSPADVVTDNIGNVYFTDGGNSCIRKITPAGSIRTIAGTGTAGYSGDGGPATAAQLSGPIGICIDAGNNIYIMDKGNFRIRKIYTTGVITTFAGTGVYGDGGDGGPATAAPLTFNLGITNDAAANIYFSQNNVGRIKKIDHATGNISTIAGDGTPCGYFGDGGLATAAKLCSPWYMTMDKKGTIYLSDDGNHRIRRISYTNTALQDINTAEAHVQIMPNPVQAGVFSITVTSTITEQANIVITNAVGIKVRELTASTNTATNVELHGAPGLYFISVQTAHGLWSEKVVVGN